MTCEPETAAARILRTARELGEGPFLTLLDSDGAAQAHTYRELLAAAARWMHHFRGRGLLPGQRIIVILPHSLDLYAAYLGAVLGGQVPVMFHFPSPKLSRQTYAKTIGALVASAEAQLIVTYTELARELPRMAPALASGIITTPQDLPPRPESTDALPSAPPSVDPDAPAILQYSSGTTGLKKGVSLSHRALLWQVDQYAEAIRISGGESGAKSGGGGDRIATWLPLYHDMGLIACLWLPLLRGVPVVAMSPFDWVRRPVMLLEAIGRHRATLCWLPNFGYQHLARSVRAADLAEIDLSCLRGLVNCSEPILDASHEALLAALAPRGLRREALWTCYALAENTFAVTSGGSDQPLFRDTVDAEELARRGRAVAVTPNPPPTQGGAGGGLSGQTPPPTPCILVSSGRALPDTQIRILDSQRHPLPERAVGQIALRSPCLMAGYFNNPRATGERFHDGWFLTGDLGYLAGDELIVLGRQDDLIIIAGKNIDPQDIEALVHQMPGIIPGRAVALGVADALSGTQKLVVIAESRESDPARMAALRRAVIDHIAAGSEAVAEDVRLVPHGWLAKSSSGKIARRENRARYLALRRDEAAPQAAATSGDPSASPLDHITQVLARTLPPGRCPPQNELRQAPALISSGLIDSVTLISLILALEEEFACTIPAADQTTLGHFESASAMAGLMARLAGTRASGGAPSGGPREIMSDRDRKCLDFLAGPRSFDLLMLGSSRIQALSARLAGDLGYRAFNFGVSSARAEDWYCILQFVLQHNRTPLRHVLLGIDIEAFTTGCGIDSRLIQSPNLHLYLDPGDRPAAPPDPPADRRGAVFLTLRQQAADTIRPFAYEPSTGDLVYTAADPVAQAFNARQPVRLADPASHDAEYKLRMHGFAAHNPKRLSYFVRTVQTCLSRGARVTAFLTPLHPALEQFLTRETTYHDRVAEFLAGLRGNRAANFRFLDCSTPASFGGTDEDFINPAHLGAHNADLLLRHLFAQSSASSNAPAAAAAAN